MTLPLLIPCRSGGRRRLIPPSHWHHLQAATFVDAKVKWVRDRGLDHAVEKEKHLRPMHTLKNLLLRHHGTYSSDSLPLSVIAERRDELRLPFRAIRFVRKYPSAFLEELPSASPPAADPHQPHVRPTPELVRLHEEEQRVYESCRAETADRLLRLLMLTRCKRLPLDVVDRLRWDLGLPEDYVRSLLPDYPDYFQIVPSSSSFDSGGRRGALSPHGGGGGRLDLELVCWNKELAVSALERSAMRTGGYKKGAPLAFPLHFSRGFDMEKKVRRWVEDWQRLPYISPYEDGSHLDPGSDLAEKWTVGVLHELLHLLVPKKTDRDDLLLLGEWVGLNPGFKRVLVHHPGIFYVSNKIRAHTVLLREAYRRDLLVEKHPLMGMRYQYIHLMRRSAALETTAGGADRKRDKTSSGRVANFIGEDTDKYGKDIEGEEDDDDDNEEEEEEGEELSGDSNFESEDDSDDDEEAANDSSVVHERVLTRRGMGQTGQQHFGMKRSSSSTSVQLNSVAKRLETRKIPQQFTGNMRNAYIRGSR